jgi:hypothetical protein
MKVQIYNWAGEREASKLLEALGYQHQGFYDVGNVFELLEKLHAAGLNVMLPQPQNGAQVVCVDFGRLFTQR